MPGSSNSDPVLCIKLQVTSRADTQPHIDIVAGRQLGGNLLRALRQSILLIAGVYFLSPLYATLARAISGDTIVAATIWLLAVHLYMHDYFFKISVAYKLAGSLSMVAAVAASLLMASRLGSPKKVVRFWGQLPRELQAVFGMQCVPLAH
jgi:hypothetical protein